MPDKVFTVHLDQSPIRSVQTVAATSEAAAAKVRARLTKDGYKPIVTKVKVSKRAVLPEEVRNDNSV